jgi:hypothetical protein
MSRPRRFGGRVRSNLSGIKAADAVSRQVAHKVQRELRRLSRLYGHFMRLDFMDQEEPIRLWLEGNANAIGPMYRPRYEWRPMMEIDRLGSSVGGLPYVTAEHPWPRMVSAGKREPMNPLVQLNLGEISDCTGVDVGRGLLQVWRSAPGDYDSPVTRLRVIERKAVRRRAEMKMYPKAYLDRISDEWHAKIKMRREFDEFFGEEDDDTLGYLNNLAIKGLIWGQDVDELRLLDPWWAGGEGAGFGPWQITGWKRHGFTLPWKDALEGLREVKAQTSEAEALHYEDDERAYDQALIALLKPVARAEGAQIDLEDKKIGCQDNLFGLPSYYNECQPSPADMPSVGWFPLFTVTGPFEADWMRDICTIYYRKKGDRYEYAITGDFYRRA